MRSIVSLIASIIVATAMLCMPSPGSAAPEVVDAAKTGVTDTWLTAKAKIAIFADERVKVTQISVATKNGVVSLRGKVNSEEAKNAATEIVSGVEHVKMVRNDLQVVPPAQRKMVEVQDEELARQVSGALSHDPQLKGTKIDVRVDDGVVLLKGSVASLTRSARASEVAGQIGGVRAVKNELTLVSDKS